MRYKSFSDGFEKGTDDHGQVSNSPEAVVYRTVLMWFGHQCGWDHQEILTKKFDAITMHKR